MSDSDSRTVVESALRALSNDSPAEFVGAFSASKDQQEALTEYCKFVAVARAFRNRFIEVYGQSEWTHFQDPELPDEPGVQYSARLTIVDEESISKLSSRDLKSTELAEYGCAVDGAELIFKVAHSGGQWRLDPFSILPRRMHAAEFAGAMRNASTLVTRYSAAIGYEKIGGGDIDWELGKALTAMWVKKPQKGPSRFNISEIERATKNK